MGSRRRRCLRNIGDGAGGCCGREAGQNTFKLKTGALAPGEYAVKVTALGPDGKRSKRMAVFAFIRRSPLTPAGSRRTARAALEMAMLLVSLV